MAITTFTSAASTSAVTEILDTKSQVQDNSSKNFKVTYVSPGTRRRLLQAASGAPSPCPMVPQPGRSCRHDLPDMEAQARASWVEQQTTLAKHLQHCHQKATIHPQDSQTARVALELMVTEAVRRQSQATPQQSAQFLLNCGKSILSPADSNSSNSATDAKKALFTDLHKMLMQDVTMFLVDHGYTGTVKSFLSVRPWNFTIEKD